MLETSLLSHLTNSVLVVQIIKWLKGTERYQRFAIWMPMAEGKVHVLMSAIGAAATGIGMHGAFTGSMGEGWKLALTIPPLWIILHSLWDWAQQLALNQIVFAVAVQQKAAAPVVTVKATPDVSVTAPISAVHGPAVV